MNDCSSQDLLFFILKEASDAMVQWVMFVATDGKPSPLFRLLRLTATGDKTNQQATTTQPDNIQGVSFLKVLAKGKWFPAKSIFFPVLEQLFSSKTAESGRMKEFAMLGVPNSGVSELGNLDNCCKWYIFAGEQ